MNKSKELLFLMALLCIALSFTACSNTNIQSMDAEGVMVTVNGKAILQEEFDRALTYYKNEVEYEYGEDAWETKAERGLTYREIYEEYIMDEMTNSLLLLDAAEKEGITVTEEEKQNVLENFKIFFENDKQYKEYLKQRDITEETLMQEMAKQVLISNYISSKFDSFNPDDDQLKSFFDDIKYNVKVKTNHILVDTEEEALKIIERINNGEDFGDLAEELSIDKVNEDEPAYKTYEESQPFSKEAFVLEIGEVCKPVQTKYGYYIIKMIDKIVDEEKTAESEKSQLIYYYKEYKLQEVLEQLKRAAVITKN